MEEAGDKVEGNIDEIKSNYLRKMQKLEDIIKKVSIYIYTDKWTKNYYNNFPVDCNKRDSCEKQSDIQKAITRNAIESSTILEDKRNTWYRSSNCIENYCKAQWLSNKFKENLMLLICEFFVLQVELEMKLEAYEKLIACEQATSK